MAKEDLSNLDLQRRKPTLMHILYAAVVVFPSPYRVLKKAFDPKDSSFLVEEYYNLGFVAVVLLILSLLQLLHATLGKAMLWFAVILSVFRLLDLLVAHLKIMLLESDRGYARRSEDGKIVVRHAQRWPILIIVDFVTVIACFATVYLAVDITWSGLCLFKENFFPQSGQGGTPLGQSLAAGINAFYFAVVTMATVGYGDFAPTSPWTRALVISQILYGLMFLTFFFVVVMNSISVAINENAKWRP